MPTVRDPFVDAVRALGTVGVVTVHWLMAEATWDGRHLLVGNALGHGAAWVLTWVLQLLPLLFFAAGAAGAYQHAARSTRSAAGSPGPGAARDPGHRARAVTRGGGGWARVLATRVLRVGRPVAVFLGAWVMAVAALLALGVPDDAVWRLARMAPQLLWFLAVWVVLVALVPVLHRAWRRWRWRALTVAVAAPLVVDLLRFGTHVPGADRLAWANLLLVWVVPFLAGIAYASDRVAGRTGAPTPSGTRPSPPRAGRTADRRRTLVLVAALATGVLALVVLVTVGPYPPSMIGMPGDAISNLGPPTAPVVALSVAQVAAVLLAREAILRATRTTLGQQVVTVLATRSMTVFLWHLTAMFIVVGLVLVVLRSRLPEPWSVDWWASRPLWLAAYLVVLRGLVLAFGRFEGPGRAGPSAHRPPLPVPVPTTSPRRHVQRAPPRLDPVPQRGPVRETPAPARNR